ncbi:Membrane associated serine protease, rhomboid family [Chryseolinea serpens]|jgi:membrane associated rhomboid family serine protease|uniref:Membrane associated serine protease, rhomboid family n=1 Tax=Chryseolinea serpens TaxID=947013 RepID=A0A1M5NBX0_9BACT|nr:rhomboid family intramembrane serine protease [Chryseolinea serpens]SHG86991.1 Membrane associated serine protease, rhomboid family [Chryseolinea serpens]
MFDDFKHAFQRYNNAHVQLIIINVVIFLTMGVLFLISDWTGTEWFASLVYRQFSIPPVFGEFLTRPWTLVTYMFAHSQWDITHILYNMLALYFFGSLFAEYLGSDKLVSMYVLGGLAGALVYLLMFNTVPFYIERSLSFPGMVGASAAVFSIVVAAATLLPDHTFFLILIGPVRIKYIAAFFVITSFLGISQGNIGGNLAHLGGALMGFVYIKQLQRGNNLGGWVTFLLQWIKNLFAPRRNVKVTYRKETSSGRKPNKASAISQAEIDAILDKISDGGYESLTKEEKEKLFNASKK